MSKLGILVGLSLALYASVQICRACTLNNCETPCKVIGHLYIYGDGISYVGGLAAYIDHVAPSVGGIPKSNQLVTRRVYDLMCMRCHDCLGDVCEGENPSSLLISIDGNGPTECRPSS
jgi:hypothetical protein